MVDDWTNYLQTTNGWKRKYRNYYWILFSFLIIRTHDNFDIFCPIIISNGFGVISFAKRFRLTRNGRKYEDAKMTSKRDIFLLVICLTSVFQANGNIFISTLFEWIFAQRLLHCNLLQIDASYVDVNEMIFRHSFHSCVNIVGVIILCRSHLKWRIVCIKFDSSRFLVASIATFSFLFLLKHIWLLRPIWLWILWSGYVNKVNKEPWVERRLHTTTKAFHWL